MTKYAELEIGLHRWDEEAYELDFRFADPNADAVVQPALSNPLLLDLDALAKVGDDAAEYGKQLSGQFFSDRAISEAFSNARSVADAQALPIRLRLRISPNAARLHSVRWETLQDPKGGGPLLQSETIVFSRSIDSGVWRHVRAKPDGALKALVVIASPTDVASVRFGGIPLAPIDVAKEEERVRHWLDGYEVEVLASAGTATLARILESIRHGVDLLYILCHGFVLRDNPRLVLEADDGTKDVVEGDALVRQIRDMLAPPRLVVLASCDSGGAAQDSRTGQVVSHLGPQLAEAGVPAVVAMQGSVTIETASKFLAEFFKELRTDGVIDRAVAVARAAVRDRADAWMPALYMRLKTGKIWFDSEPDRTTASFAKWDALMENIRNGRCTPVLGFGVYDELFGPLNAIARRWAETYRYPFHLEGRDDLPQVAQYLSVTNDAQYPRYELQNHFRRELQRRHSDLIDGDPLTIPLDELITQVWKRAAGPGDAHRILARLPCPAYVTTNLSTILESALADAGRKQVSAVCPWYSGAEIPNLPNPLSAEQPVVYHLFGKLGNPDSIVVSEDDYFDYLIETTAKRDLIANSIRSRFNSSALLFLGFQINDWNFRALFRSLATSEGRELRRKFVHVAVQVNPDRDDVEEPDVVFSYLERYFEQERITIFRGSVAEFMATLAERWTARFHEDLVKKV